MSHDPFPNSGSSTPNDIPGAMANSNNCSSSRWLTEEVFKLIDKVQSEEAIYNPRHKYYFCRPYVENFWREVDLKLEKNPGASLAKWTNLRISFRREYTNYLEEKVPPCWSYFDRMFFLHPFLRKKHQQSKVSDSQMQEMATLSRIERDRLFAAVARVVGPAHTPDLPHTEQNFRTGQKRLENYLDYLDDISESDELVDEEQQMRFRNLDTSLIANDIKSECEEYDVEPRQQDDERDEHDPTDTNAHNIMINSFSSAMNAPVQEKRYNLRQQNMQRQNRSTSEDDVRAKRPRSHDGISSSQSGNSHGQRTICSSTSTHANVSFVRPTFAKPMDAVSTTSSMNQTSHNVSDVNDSNELGSSPLTTPALAIQTALFLPHHQQQRCMTQHHRIELGACANIGGSQSNSANVTSHAGSASSHMEYCDCKTDPDAMFLMSLLPDIQKLNGRDRGKIKIAFQNILQDYLYPD